MLTVIKVATFKLSIYNFFTTTHCVFILLFQATFISILMISELYCSSEKTKNKSF